MTGSPIPDAGQKTGRKFSIGGKFTAGLGALMKRIHTEHQ